MEFIELTSHTGCTIIVRVDYIGVVTTYVDDDEGERYTEIWLGTNDDNFVHVTESPEEIYRRINLSKNAGQAPPLTEL